MPRMLVFVSAMLSRSVLVVMSLFACYVAMFVRVFMFMGMLVLMAVLMFMGFFPMRVFMLMIVLMLVFVLMLVRMFAFHGSLLSTWNYPVPMNFGSNEQAISCARSVISVPSRND
ncbi:MAG TPA: hypothetical protein VL197_02855 [Nitrospirota bacterium]|nr:hypothetical protein [Nitrospirota bacterium]